MPSIVPNRVRMNWISVCLHGFVPRIPFPIAYRIQCNRDAWTSFIFLSCANSWYRYWRWASFFNRIADSRHDSLFAANVHFARASHAIHSRIESQKRTNTTQQANQRRTQQQSGADKISFLFIYIVFDGGMGDMGSPTCMRHSQCAHNFICIFIFSSVVLSLT